MGKFFGAGAGTTETISRIITKHNLYASNHTLFTVKRAPELHHRRNNVRIVTAAALVASSRARLVFLLAYRIYYES